METYRAAVIQLNSQPDVDANLEQVYAFVKQAAGKGARLVGLPENFAFLGNLTQRLEEADSICSKTESFLIDTAKEFGLYLLGGGYPKPADKGKVFNRALLVNPQGETVAQYDKIHLFDVDLRAGESYRESDYVAAGSGDAVLYKSDEMGCIGLSICYDIRFPELYRMQSFHGADLLAIPSAFTETTGNVHWMTLVKARAIENLAYVFAPAQTGTHGLTSKTYGHAAIVDPWGEVLVDAGRDTGVYTATIDPNRIKEVRRCIPSLQHRRFLVKKM
jgi:predicted amidohydrolase